jgi:nicotinate-nucleotide--dimethylbenzimidazole phosphoribosyltransferase
MKETILVTGDMGINKITPSTAIGAMITGKPPEQMVGRGTVIDDISLIKKKRSRNQGISCKQPGSPKN